MNFHQKIVIAALDVALLVEVGVSITLAGRDPDNLTPVFLKSFFVMVLPTLILARVLFRMLRSKEPEAKT